MNINTKLLLPMFCILFIFFAALHLYLSPKWLQVEHETFLQQQYRLLNAMESVISRNVLSGNYAALHAYVDDAMETHADTWRQLTVKNPDGNLLYPLVEPALIDSTINIDNIEHNIELAKAPLVKINLVSDWSTFKGKASREIQEFETILISVICIMTVIGISLVNILILLPIKKLKDSANLMAQGDFSVALQARSKDEIGQLTQAFLTMRNSLYDNQESLQEALDEAQTARKSLLSKQVALSAEYEKTSFALHTVKAKTAELEQAHKALELSHQQAIHAEKLASVGQLAAGIAHEINTPIQFVGDNTRFLQDSFEDLIGLVAVYEEMANAANEGKALPELVAKARALSEEVEVDYLAEEVPSAISQSLEGIERVSKIVRSMKDFSHPGTDNLENIDLNDAIDSTINVSRNEWKYVAEMVTEFDSTLTVVPCFLGELNQVILNMIVNAAHAIKDSRNETDPLGTITISTKLSNDNAEIRISDSGCGMTEDVRKRVFEPFYTTKGVGAGTGQGLAIAYAVIVEKHKGDVSVESEPGKGTTFIIDLPMNTTVSNSDIDESEGLMKKSGAI
ncbi:MAG: ATP-binding protein [Gammaproteobacteria bacterium]|nr:ATP-binding protein [Gammaproteobacteria bacterium]